MITITTINNSWYFLGDLVIKPNSSSAYQEENLSKNQAKDLLESVSSKRVSLSPEDLIKVQNRYDSFNSGGNVDLSGIISKIENIYKDDGVSSGVLVDEIDERIAADLDITEALNNKASLGVDGKILSEQLPDAITTPDWSSISSKPTTISGYGITDAYTKTEVDSLIPAGGSGGYSGYGMTRPKFINGSSYYLTNVWHDYTFGWVPSCTYSSITFGNDVYMVPFIPLQNCTISAIGITTSLAFASTIKFGFYSSGSDLKPNTRLFASSAFSTAVVNTLLSASTGGISVTAGSVYWIALFVAGTGNPSLTTITNNLFSIASSGYANTNSQVVAGYRFNGDGLGTITDLPMSVAGAGYYNTTIVPRLVFKIS